MLNELRLLKTLNPLLRCRTTTDDYSGLVFKPQILDILMNPI